MAHRLQIKARRKDGQVAAGFDCEVLLDGRPLEWIDIVLTLAPADMTTVTLRLPLSELDVDANVILALKAIADKRTNAPPALPERSYRPTGYECHQCGSSAGFRSSITDGVPIIVCAACGTEIAERVD